MNVSVDMPTCEAEVPSAIQKIDANGVDAELRPDLVDLRDSLKVTA